MVWDGIYENLIPREVRENAAQRHVLSSPNEVQVGLLLLPQNRLGSPRPSPLACVETTGENGLHIQNKFRRRVPIFLMDISHPISASLPAFATYF